jgi:hypothetical protein
MLWLSCGKVFGVQRSDEFSFTPFGAQAERVALEISAVIEARTGKKVLGVLPFVAGLQVAEEDSLPESRWRRHRASDSDKLDVVVIPFPHLLNSTDFDSLESEPDVHLRCSARQPEPGESLPDLLVLPGSKSTMTDLPTCIRPVSRSTSIGATKSTFPSLAYAVVIKCWADTFSIRKGWNPRAPLPKDSACWIK